MSHIPRITFIGAYNYDPHLFDSLTFPAGVAKDLAVNTFLMRFGECPMLYTDLRFQKTAFAVWSNKWADGIARMLLALESEYNPIHNFDRYEDYSESELTSETTDYTGSETAAYTGSETTAYTGSETTDYTGSQTVTESESDTTVNEVSAYDESTYQPDKQSVSERETETETERDMTDTHARNMTDTHTRALNDSRTRALRDATAGNKSTNHVGHLYGNIGLTTSQQMILAEIDMRGKYNIYDIIAELLHGEFCLYYY